MSGRVNSFAAGPVPPEAWAMTERFDVSRDGITLAGERWTARPPSSTCAPWPVPTRNPADASKISLAIGVPPLALPVAIISPVAPRTATGGPPAGRTTSPGSCLAVPPARPGRHVVALSVHCQPPAAGWLARGSSCRRRAGGWFFAGPADAAQVVAGSGFRLAVGGECRLGGQVGVCGGGEVICSGMPAQADGNSRASG